MANTFKLILFAVSGISGGILALALKQSQILSRSFDGRWIAVAFALVGLLLGHYIDNKRECARIARELNQEGIEIAEHKSELGRLLISQSGATHLSSIYSVIITLLCWGFGSFILLTGLRNEFSYLPHILIAVGALSLLMILLRGIKSITCYERGVVVRQPFKSRTILHSDVAGIEFLAVAKYNSGIYQGITSHFEIIPCVDNPVKIRIWGSRQDGQRVGSIVQLILSTNPDAKLLKIRGFDELN